MILHIRMKHLTRLVLSVVLTMVQSSLLELLAVLAVLADMSLGGLAIRSRHHARASRDVVVPRMIDQFTLA